MIKAGALTHVVTIQTFAIGSPQQLADGSPNGEWATHLSNVSAEIKPLSGRELYAAQEHHAEARVRFNIRWRDSITPQMRVVYGGLYYPIVWVPPVDRDGRKEEMELLTTQGVKES